MRWAMMTNSGLIRLDGLGKVFLAVSVEEGVRSHRKK